jgi:hypothetical protein
MLPDILQRSLAILNVARLKGPHIRHSVAPPEYIQLYHSRRDNKAAEPPETSSVSLQTLSTIIMASENPSMTLDPKYDHYDYPTTAPTKQTGHPGHLTPEQEAQVFQLRMMLEQKGYKERLDTLTMVRDLGLCVQVQGC